MWVGLRQANQDYADIVRTTSLVCGVDHPLAGFQRGRDVQGALRDLVFRCSSPQPIGANQQTAALGQGKGLNVWFQRLALTKRPVEYVALRVDSGLLG